MCIHKATSLVLSSVLTLVYISKRLRLPAYPLWRGGVVAKRPPLRLGRLLRQGGETHGSVRANVSASVGGFTAWAAVVNAQIRSGVAGAPNP